MKRFITIIRITLKYVTYLRWHRGDMEKYLKYRYYYVAT